MTKEPNKDFRTALLKILDEEIGGGIGIGGCEVVSGKVEATVRILALCKEMLAHKERPLTIGEMSWKACRQHLLKQLGEK